MKKTIEEIDRRLMALADALEKKADEWPGKDEFHLGYRIGLRWGALNILRLSMELEDNHGT
jgi:hypothetical protein